MASSMRFIVAHSIIIETHQMRKSKNWFADKATGKFRESDQGIS